MKIQLAVLNSGFSSPNLFWHRGQNQPEPAEEHDDHIPFKCPTPDVGDITEYRINNDVSGIKISDC